MLSFQLTCSLAEVLVQTSWSRFPPTPFIHSLPINTNDEEPFSLPVPQLFPIFRPSSPNRSTNARLICPRGTPPLCSFSLYQPSSQSPLPLLVSPCGPTPFIFSILSLLFRPIFRHRRPKSSFATFANSQTV